MVLSDTEQVENKEMEIETADAVNDEEPDYDPFNPWTKVGKNSNKSTTSEQEDKANWRKYYTKIENGWVVEEIDPVSSKSIDDIFDAQEDKIKENLNKKLDIIKKKGKKLNKKEPKRLQKQKQQHDALKNLKDLSFKNEIIKPVIDEELTNELDPSNEELNKTQELLNKAINNTPEVKGDEKPAVSNITDTIDPNKLATVKLKQHKHGFGDDVHMDEEDIDPYADQQMTIAQAFEDDDIVADFSKDKSKDSEVKDAEIQLAMPSWVNFLLEKPNYSCV